MNDTQKRLYSKYLREHCANVRVSFNLLYGNGCLSMFENDVLEKAKKNINNHDSSKKDDEEFGAYAEYFYGLNKSYVVARNFDYAWLHHIHNNPHHWQYWILINDTGETKLLEMPDEYIIEMICDWMSFAIKINDVKQLFSWYEKNSSNIQLNDETRKKVEKILAKISYVAEEA